MNVLHTRRMRRASLGLLALSGLWYASGVAAGMLLTRRAAPAFPEPPPPGYRGVRLHSEDGEELGAWLATGSRDDVAVVIAHGNGGSRTSLLQQAEDLHRRGCTVMPVSLRAHGDSTGERNDIGWSARHDVAAAVAHLHAQRPDRPVVILGTSLGAAAAVFAGAEEDVRADGYILVGVYADLRRAVRRRTTRYLPRPLSWLAYGALLAAAPAVLPELDSISPVKAAPKLPQGTRLLLFAGADDDRAPVADANAIAEEVPGARVITLEGIGHDELGEAVHDAAWGPAVDRLLRVARR